MPTVYPLNYQPYLDLSWNVNPGACSDMSGFMQLQDGSLGTLRADYSSQFSSMGWNVTGADHLHAEIFAQTSGGARLLTFRKQNIDEYNNAGTRTNRGTGYNASTADWSAAAWGNQIIACNYLDATQSSTGAGFTALGGSSPKARYIASNINFVMMADVDDGGSNVFSDMVWWGGIRNPNTWTPSQATQAGFVRLLDTPGPIKQIVAFGDKFVAFKETGIYLGQYIGPPYVFSWRLIIDNIGLTFPKAVTQCDGKLFFCHTSGVYSYDGQSFQNIGRGMWYPTDSSSRADTIRMRGDDVEGNVFIGVHTAVVSTFTQNLLYAYGYNCRTGLWARLGLVMSSDPAANNPEQPIVYGSTAEYRAFLDTWGVRSGFAWLNNASTSRIGFLGTGTLDQNASISTGFVGNNEGAPATTRVYPRLRNSSPNAITGTLTAAHQELGSDTVVTLGWNTEMSTLDGMAVGRYKSVVLGFGTNKLYNVAGVGFDNFPAGRR